MSRRNLPGTEPGGEICLLTSPFIGPSRHGRSSILEDHFSEPRGPRFRSADYASQVAPNRCSFFGSKAAGAKLNAMLEAGASQPWQVTLKQMTGEDHLDATPMIEYFQPLTTWLKQQNALNRSKAGWQPERSGNR